MSNPEHTSAELQKIDSICDSFEAAWKLGQPPDLHEVVDRLPDAIRQTCVMELVILDAFYQNQSGNSQLDDSLAQSSAEHDSDGLSRIWRHYVEEFPELAMVHCPFDSEGSPEDSLIDRRFRVNRFQAMGGLGRVSIAQDIQFGREVAIKEIRAKYSERKSYRERFVREAEITGRLEHPSIVPVYAMGRQSDGKPYYAMRLVQGQSLLEAINDYHSAHTVNLTIEMRQLLRRLIDICDAVEYAHSQNVIHRDIKPDNIMLGDYGETLLVDWGLAKVVGQPDVGFPVSNETPGSSRSQTRVGDVLGTPAYMSPEQSSGGSGAVDRRSDVYSLGATLLHLVKGGANPANNNPGSKASGKVKLGRPGRTIRTLLSIGEKATSIKPNHRYPSARAFANDIELVLADQPIAIFRDPIGTRFLRFARHHRASTGAATAATCLAIVALVVFAWLTGQHANEVEEKNSQLDQLVEQEIRLRNEAEKSEQRTVDAMNYLVGAMRSPDPNLDGRDVRVVDILEQAADRLDSDFADEPLMLAQMLQAIGCTYNGLGQLQEAKVLLERAHAIYSDELGPGDRKTLLSGAKLATLYQRLDDSRGTDLIADVLQLSLNSLNKDDEDRLEIQRLAAIIKMQSGHAKQAWIDMEKLVPSYDAVFGPKSSETLSLMNDLANAFHLGGRSADAAVISKNVYESRLAANGKQSLSTIVNGSNYATHLLNASDRQQARQILENLLVVSREHLGDEHFQTLAIMSKLGMLLVHNNELENGVELLKESKTLSERRYGVQHSRTLVAANGLGIAYLESGDYQNAADHLRTVYDASVNTRGADHPETLTVANNLASAYRLNKDLNSAIEIFQATLSAQLQRLGDHHPNTIRSMLNLAATMQLAARHADSIPLCQKANQLATQHLDRDSGQAQTALSLEAMAHLELKNFGRAKTLLQAGLESRMRTIPNHWLRYNTMSLLGEAHLKLGELEQAESLLLNAYEKMLDQKDKMPIRSHIRVDQARQRIFALYQAMDMPELADKYRSTD